MPEGSGRMLTAGAKGPEWLLTTGAAMLLRPMRLLSTGAAVLVLSGGLLTTEAAMLEGTNSLLERHTQAKIIIFSPPFN